MLDDIEQRPGETAVVLEAQQIVGRSDLSHVITRVDAHLEAALCGLVLYTDGDYDAYVLEAIEERLLLARQALREAA